MTNHCYRALDKWWTFYNASASGQYQNKQKNEFCTKNGEKCVYNRKTMVTIKNSTKTNVQDGKEFGIIDTISLKVY